LLRANMKPFLVMSISPRSNILEMTFRIATFDAWVFCAISGTQAGLTDKIETTLASSIAGATAVVGMSPPKLSG
jgi:hypothetical protein